jgi:hypothetical protein
MESQWIEARKFGKSKKGVLGLCSQDLEGRRDDVVVK